jgi:hypothetical protein
VTNTPKKNSHSKRPSIFLTPKTQNPFKKLRSNNNVTSQDKFTAFQEIQDLEWDDDFVISPHKKPLPESTENLQPLEAKELAEKKREHFITLNFKGNERNVSSQSPSRSNSPTPPSKPDRKPLRVKPQKRDISLSLPHKDSPTKRKSDSFTTPEKTIKPKRIQNLTDIEKELDGIEDLYDDDNPFILSPSPVKRVQTPYNLSLNCTKADPSASKFHNTVHTSVSPFLDSWPPN